MSYNQEPVFINRSLEPATQSDWIAQRSENILFICGPKSSGKTTFLCKFVREQLDL